MKPITDAAPSKKNYAANLLEFVFVQGLAFHYEFPIFLNRPTDVPGRLFFITDPFLVF